MDRTEGTGDGVKSDAAGFWNRQPRPEGLILSLACKHEQTRCESGVDGKEQIIHLVACHKAMPGIKTVAVAQSFP